MLIGFFGFYAKLIPWYKDLIAPCRSVLKKKPPVNTLTDQEAKKLTNLWTPLEDSLIHVMKDSILSGPVLKRPKWDRTFMSRRIGVALLRVVLYANLNILRQQKKLCRRNEKKVVPLNLIRAFPDSD